MFIESRMRDYPDCELFGTALLGRNDLEKSKITLSTLVSCRAVRSDVNYTTMANSLVSGSILRGGVVENSTVFDSDLENFDISGATVVGVKASDITVHTGVWTRKPITRKVVTSKKIFEVSECVSGRIDVNCMCRKTEEWLTEAGPRYLKSQGFSEEEIGKVIQAVKEVDSERKRCSESD